MDISACMLLTDNHRFEVPRGLDRDSGVTRAEGFALSYIAVLYTVDYWLHDLRTRNPELEGFLDWAVLTITAIRTDTLHIKQ